MIDLSIIIVSYNTKDVLKECLESIFENLPKKYSFEVIVVDNASTDGSAQAIQNSKFKIQNDNVKFKIIQNKENLGFSRANNIGVRASSGRYKLFLNSDTVVYKDTLEKMIPFMEEHKNAGAVTCRVNLTSGKLDDAAHRGFPTPWNAFCYFSGLSRIFPGSRIFARYSLGFEDLLKTHEIDACAGAFMMTRKEAGEQVGWWDEDYFWYGEDIDFCYRLKEKGWKIYFVPDVSILHYKGVSGGIKQTSQHLTTATDQTRKIATKARFDAMKLFYEKHYTNKYPKIITKAVFLGINLKSWVALRSV